MILKPILLLAVSTLVFLTGCSSSNHDKLSDYETITATKAKEIISQESDAIILDVRSESEYLSGHIANAILLPHDQISEQAEALLTDKDATILVYCRSGRRSAIAAEELSSLGYTNIYNFGGINDWPDEIVTN